MKTHNRITGWLCCVAAMFVCQVAFSQATPTADTAAPPIMVSDNSTGLPPNSNLRFVAADARAAASTVRSETPGDANANPFRNEQAGVASSGPVSQQRAVANFTRKTTQPPAYVRAHYPTITAAAIGAAPQQQPAAVSDTQVAPHVDRPWAEATEMAQTRSGSPELQTLPIDENLWAQSATPIRLPDAPTGPIQPQSEPECGSIVEEAGEPADSPLPTDNFAQPAPAPRRSPIVAAEPKPAPRATDNTPKKPSTNSNYTGLWSQLSGSKRVKSDAATPDSNVVGGVKSRTAAAPPNNVEQAAAWSVSKQSSSTNNQQSTPTKTQNSGGLFSGLVRPFTVKTNETPNRRSNVRQTADYSMTSGETKSEVAESEQVPALMRPFYQANDTPQNSQIGRQDLERTVRKSALVQQLSMSGESERGSQAATNDNLPPRSTREARDSGWTMRVPSELNPLAMPSYQKQSTGARSGARTVAYEQELQSARSADAAEPNKLSLTGDPNSAEREKVASDDNGDNQNNEADDNGKQKKKDEKLATADKLGEKPEDRSLEFLRAETVLLKPGKRQFDIGFMYAIQERDFPILFRSIDPANPADDIHVTTTSGKALSYSVDEARFKSRELEVPMQLRCGLFEHVQAFIGAPVGWSSTEVDLNHHDEIRNDGGLGDIYWGSTIQLHEAEADCPYVVGTGVVTAPSGGDPFTGITGFAPSAPSLGNGFWRLAGNLLFIQPLDPVTFFYGAGIRGSFDHDYIGATFQPGMEYNYTFGMGFAINEKVTFSSQLFGAYQSELKVNGQHVDGSAQEPIALQLAATIARPCEHYIEPFIQFGMTRDAPSANLGITWTY